MSTSKLTSKGQVTIPRAVRKALGAEEGDLLLFEVREPGEAYVRVVKRRSLTDLSGALKSYATEPFPGTGNVRARVKEALRRSRWSPRS